jgi:hypothetical protein
MVKKRGTDPLDDPFIYFTCPKQPSSTQGAGEGRMRRRSVLVESFWKQGELF